MVAATNTSGQFKADVGYTKPPKKKRKKRPAVSKKPSKR